MEQGIYFFRCAECGTRNKIPEAKIGVRATCGKCKTEMNTEELLNDKPMVITAVNFNEKVIKSPLPVLLDCWAPWCGPCKMMAPVMDELASEWKGRARVCKLEVDENPDVAARFRIQSIPTMIILDRGVEKETMIGALPKQQIKMKMAPYL
ncbi:MAG: thioredoxin [Desulfobacterales bacterium]